MSARGHDDRLSGWTLMLTSCFAILLIGGLAAAVTWAFHPGPRTPCTLDCQRPSPGDSGTPPLSSEKTFSSPLGWSFDYASKVDVKSVTAGGGSYSGAEIDDGGAGGALLLGKDKASVSDPLVFGPLLWNVPNETPLEGAVGNIAGAHVGSQDGNGLLYSGTITPQSGGGQAIEVRLAFVAATREGSTVLFSGIAPYDREDENAGGRGFGGHADRYLSEFWWQGER
jgi:hypothetical protein